MRGGKKRAKYRALNITVDLDTVVETTQALVDSWTACCQRGPNPFGVERVENSLAYTS